MASAIILALALAALGHFGMFLWRLGIITLAAEPLSDRIFAAAPDNSLDEKGFQALSSLNEMCPELDGCGSHLGMVRIYHRGIHAVDRLAGVLVPSVTRWTQQELCLCARYVAVEIDRRIARNQACFAALRSY